ncbi:MAG TPA: 6-bladed beta-propeller [Gracilimonas sp.]|uniref:6-bladed beta-propeller n=1 Tax=Gracilimonas sp. TaxID=1974203 RepID=UPI002D90B4B3|nr:6-bladed beta-propeller [Gracilimonas sp.]
MKYSQRLLLFIFLCFFLIHCSDNPRPKKIPPVPVKQAEVTGHIRVLDEIPQHIQSVDSLTIFPGDSEPLYSVELIPVLSFGKTGEPYLTQVLDCIVDDKGRVIIKNTSRPNYEQILHVFNADGSYHTQIGRHGAGPGEYRHIIGLQAKAEKIFMMDYNNQRVNEYSTKDYSFVRSILFENWKNDDGLRFGYVEARNDGNYLLVFFDDGSKLGRLEFKFQVMDDEGNAVNAEPLVFPHDVRIKVGQSSQPTMSTISFLGRTVTALSHEDALYTVWNRDFLIKKYDAAGVYQSAIYYPITGSAFDLDEYIKTQLFSPKARDIKEAFSNMDEGLPETFPVIDILKVDDENRMWVGVPAGAQREYYEWWILNEGGELLAKLVLPKAQRIYEIKNGHLYSEKMNEETGTEYVVKYRIELTEK